jgi:hypothetical protein
MTEKELLEEAHQLHIEKIEASKAMNLEANDCAERNGIEKSIVLRLKDYRYYHGNGWEGGDPLTLEKGAKFADRVSPCFRRLALIIDDCQQAGTMDYLQEYIDAMETRGIHITIDPKPQVAKSADDVKHSVSSLGGYQAVICSNADKIRDECGEQAEEMDFAPKNKFKELVGFYHRQTEGKDIHDPVMDRVAFCELYENALNKIHDEGVEE